MKRTLLYFFLIFTIGIILAVIYPYHMVNPGVLIGGHSKLQSDCMACHTLLASVPDAKCINCHPQINQSSKNKFASAQKIHSQKSLLVHEALTVSCLTCHSEHTGLEFDKKTIHFSHDYVKSSLLSSCAPCHVGQRPANAFHKRTDLDCKMCHTTESWNDAHFDHKLTDANSSCISCHESQTPKDALHNSLQSTQSCSTCHSVNAWKPSTFEHSRYFRFDEDHPSDCAKCHSTANDFKSYTCYNCHEHSPAKIAEEHREEGINSYTNCVQCHRSGNKHEIIGREGRSGGEGGHGEGGEHGGESDGD